MLRMTLRRMITKHNGKITNKLMERIRLALIVGFKMCIRDRTNSVAPRTGSVG